MKRCSYCHAELEDDALKCRYCGEWVTGVQIKRIEAGPATVTVAAPQQVSVVVRNDEGLVFPLITLVCYLVTYPLGLVLNIIGLFLGSRRGCFVAMLVVFLFVPLALLVLVLFGVGMVSVVDKMN